MCSTKNIYVIIMLCTPRTTLLTTAPYHWLPGIFCLYSSTIYSVYLFMLKYFVEIYKICYQINQVISLPVSIIFHVFVECFICNNISQIVFPIKNSAVLFNHVCRRKCSERSNYNRGSAKV